MAASDRELLTQLLIACFEAAPKPLYAVRFAQQHGVDRTVLDQALDELRHKGLIRLTEWEQGQGQGYTLTQAGANLLEHPHDLRPGALLPTAPAPVEEPDEDFEPRREPLIRPGRPIVSWTLIAINVVIFILTEPPLTPFPEVGVLLSSGGQLTTESVLARHQWWRLISYAFLHGSMIHLACNMYFFYSIGPLMEAIWGSFRLLLLYLVGAMAGGGVVVWVNRMAGGHPIATVGASGALCGLLASLGVWVMLNREHLPPAMASSLSRNVMINLILIAVMSFAIENVSWEGHLGGAIGGALASFPLQLWRHGSTWSRRIAGIAGTVMVGVAFVALAFSRIWIK